MSNKIITLSGAATDVLYALFFRGALQSGDLPSKSGAADLRELGFAETRHTATYYQKENYFTFLTAEGQAFAVKHLVNTRFGEPAGGYIGSPKDVSNGNSRVKHLVCILSASVNAQNEPEELRQAIANIVNETIRTETQPGGLLWNNRGGR